MRLYASLVAACREFSDKFLYDLFALGIIEIHINELSCSSDRNISSFVAKGIKSCIRVTLDLCSCLFQKFLGFFMRFCHEILTHLLGIILAFTKLTLEVILMQLALAFCLGDKLLSFCASKLRLRKRISDCILAVFQTCEHRLPAEFG